MNQFPRLRSSVLILLAVGVAGCSGGHDPFLGTEWKLTGWSVSSIDPASVTITVKFAENQVSGNSGVNSYSGPYTIGSGGKFSSGPFVSTKMAALDESAMRAEQMYLTLLEQAKSYKVAGRQLTLLDAGGNPSLIFERQKP